jgi:hypothetical protein
MSKEIRTIAWCDGFTHAEYEQVEAAVTRRFAADTLKECEIDLCEVCDKTIVQPLLDLLTEHGQPVKGAKTIQPVLPVAEDAPRVRTTTRRPAEIKCPIDECDWEGSRSAGGMHAPKAHGGQTLPVLEGRYGRRLLNGSRLTLEHPCPQCEAAYDSRPGLTTHLRAHAA